MALGGIIQVVIAIALVIILCVVAFLIYNAEMVKSIRDASKIKKRVPIFEGVKDLSISKDESYNTLDPAHPLYRPIENSLNQKAGAEYTYNFWLYVADSFTDGASDTNEVYNTDTGLTKYLKKGEANTRKPMVLFLRGSKQAVPYKSHCANARAQVQDQYKIDVLVKQPLVKLERDGDVLVVELNTQKHPDGVKEKARDTCSDNSTSWEKVNSYRLAVKGFKSGFKDKWNMITLIVQDTFPTDPLPLRNKVRVRMYVNGVMEMDRYVDGRIADTSLDASTIRMNSGSLYVAPEVKILQSTQSGQSERTLSRVLDNSTETKNVMLADLTYFNYAIDEVERMDLFGRGFKKEYARTVSSTSSSSVGDAGDIDAVLNNMGTASLEPRLTELM